MSYSGAGFKGGTRQIRAVGVRDILRLRSSGEWLGRETLEWLGASDELLVAARSG